MRLSIDIFGILLIVFVIAIFIREGHINETLDHIQLELEANQLD
jgi:hypothetical protein